MPSVGLHRHPCPLWREQCAAALRIRQRFGLDRALIYLVSEKLLTAVGKVDRDGVGLAEVWGFANEVNTIFTPDELREYFRKARMRKHPGIPTDDLRYTPDEAQAVERMKQLVS